MKKLSIILAFLFVAAFTYGAYPVATQNQIATEKYDDKPKKETEKTEASTSTEAQKTEQTSEEKTEKKECTKTTSGCSKEEKSSCCKKN